ncbi:MAG: nucleotide exchange factor GrpE [Bacteroidales bacterium]|nr:nucleotide exchange factor GrpE [Bacteroidales bacterium]MDD3906734.1 nucleotide exchange factor GrpE [Bacteroidales bacterium]MDD4713050.1 nucleotide exchange factor GrpE [Bacteroidales bacterium]
MKHTKTEAGPKNEEQHKNEIPVEKTKSENKESEEATASEKEAEVEKEEARDFAENEVNTEKKAFDELQAKYNQLNDTYLRSLAEFDNYRKRSLREKSELIKNGGEKVLVSILDVVDDMERGLAATKEAKDIEAVKQGMELIYSKLQAFLKQNGVTRIETENKIFDTDLHEAITTIPAPTEDLKDKVIDCVQKGYYLNEKVIRFAKVIVGK